MTLADILPALTQLPTADKLTLVRLLIAELHNSQNDSQNISPFQPFKTYYFPTPYNAFGAGSILMQALVQSNAQSQQPG